MDTPDPKGIAGRLSPEDHPCPHCGDSGYAETYGGGIWTGEGVTVRHTICVCACGESLREELSSRTYLIEESHDGE